MLKFLKILTVLLAVFLIVMKTMSVRVTGASVLTLIPMYSIAALLLSFLIFKNNAAKLLLSGWGVLLGFCYFALIENLPPRPMFLDILFGAIVAISIGGILLTNYLIHASHADSSQSLKQPKARLTTVSLMIAGLFILIGVFSIEPLRSRISYMVLGIIIGVLGFYIESKPAFLFIGVSIALGFVFSGLVGLIRFFEPSGSVLALTGITTIASLLGLVLVFYHTNIQFKLLKSSQTSQMLS